MGTGARRPPVDALVDSLSEVVCDGALIATGGGELKRKPMAAVRALAALGRCELRLATMLGSADVELLLGAGCLGEVHTAGVALTGLAPRWRSARETGVPRVIEWSEGSFLAAVQAGALRLDSQLWAGGVGTDLPRLNPWLKEVSDPHTGSLVLCVRALIPDVVLLHVDGLDEEGNAHVEGDLVLDGLLARAARHVFVTYERRVDADPALAAISRIWIDTAIEAAGGAAPTACALYDVDPEALRSL